MPVTRMRMRPWLEHTLDSQRIDGLKWIDKDKKMFSIPWKHAARHGWQVEKDACLFKLWAIHTGKFRPDAPPDPKTWKANFRCALNSLPDIEEVKNQSINKGCGAVRVYQMLPEMPRKKSNRSRSRDGKRTKSSLNIKRKRESSLTSTEEESLTQESTVDSTEDTEEIVGCPLSYLSDHEVPEISTSVEIGPDSTSPWSFQVSPAHHSTDYDDDLIGLSQQLERDDAQWSASDIDGKGFLINELGSLTDNIVRAKSRWSDTSDMPDEIELHVVTELLHEWNQFTQRQNEEQYSWDWTTTCITS